MKSTILFRYIITNLIALAFTGFLLKSQTPLRIMPLGNSITYDSIFSDTRDMGDKISYRYQLYQLLNTEGYTYNFIGSEHSGGNYLPAGYVDHAGFSGISAVQLLTLLQTGVNDREGGICELPSCPQSYLEYYDPDIILLHIGTNGLTDSASAPGIVSDIEDILDYIDTYEASSGKTIPVFLAQIINRAGSSASGNHLPTSYLNDLLPPMLATRGADVVRLIDMETGAGISYRYSPPGDMIDYLHPAPSGYTKMGTTWYNALESYNYTAPVVSNIPNQSRSEGQSFATIDLNDYVFDPQEADANITWTYSTPTNLNISISSGKIATITVKNAEWNGSETITFTAYDSGNGSTPLSGSDGVTFTITAVNDEPVLSGIETTPLSYTEGDGDVNVTSTIAVSDVDDVNLESAVVNISSGYNSSEDILRFNNQNGITGIWVAGTGTMNLNGTATLANYQAALRSIRYENTNVSNPSTTGRTVSFRVNDGTGNSNVVSRGITIAGENNAPVLSNLEGTPLSYTEGGDPVNITSAITVSDADDTNLEGATIRITGFVSAQDRLYFTTQNGINGTYNPLNGILQLYGTSSVSNYQTAIRSITYRNINEDNPVTTARSISFTVSDGTASSNTPQRTLNVLAVNDAPVLSGLETSPIPYTEGQGEVYLTSAIAVSDVDDLNMESALVNISSGYNSSEDVLKFNNQNGITGSWSVSTGTMTLSGTATVANYQSALRSIRYENTNVTNPSTTGRTVSFRVNDGNANSNIASRSISINATNNPPVLSNLETSTISYTEGQSPVNVTNSILVQDVDNTNLVSATVRITGFVQFEDQLNFTVPGGSGISGFFNPTTGVLTFTNPSLVANYQLALRSITYQNLNLDDPSTAARSISFTVNDGTNPSNTPTRALTVTTVNDPPVLAPLLLADPIPYTEGQEPVNFASTITVNDVDNENLVSATIRIDQNGTTGEDILRYPAKIGKINGSYNASSFTLTLSGSDTPANYQLAIRSLQYENQDTLDPSTLLRRIAIDVNDGTNPAAEKAYRNISITPVNDPPVAENVSISGLKTIFGLNTINYVYNDPENNAEGATAYTWKRSTNKSSDSTIIPGAITKQYTLQYTDGGKWLRATVQPADVLGAVSPYKYVSPWYYINAAPVAQNVRIGGIIAIGQTDTVRFNYADFENNQPNTGAHRYFWYRADNQSGVNKTQISTSRTYTINEEADNNKYISCAVAPVATSGSLVGDTVQSEWYGPITRLPSATISGNDTLCAGEKAQVRLALTGTSPWSVTYTINNIEQPPIPKIVRSDTTLLTDKPGTYRLTKVSDAKYNNGIVNGQAYVGLHDTVKVVLSAVGDTAICDDGVSAATFSASFTGTSPWSFVLSINNDDTTYTNVTQDPFTFFGRKPGSYEIKSVSDKHCTSLNGSQRAITVLYKPSPVATIAGVDTICPGDTADLTVTLTKGTAPWGFTYTVNGLNPKTITGINVSTYTLKALSQGVHKITVLEDAVCTGKATGQGTVVYRSAPAANLSGGGTVCEGTNASLRVDLAGTAPWSFSYKRGSVIVDTLTDVLATPRLFTVKNAGTYTLGHVQDKYCKGTVTGSVAISIIPAPDVELTGLNQTYSVNSDPVPVFGSPSGGVFSGNGLIPKNDTMFFLPSWAGVENSPHKISYTFQDPVSGCFGKDTMMVNVLEVEADIIFPDGKVFYCFNDPPFTVTGANIVGDTGTFSISGGVGLVDNGDNTAIINPTQLSGDVYEITYTYIKDNIPLSRKEEFTVEYVNPIWFVGFSKDVYCSNDPSVKLNGNVEEGIFYGDAVSGNPTAGFYYVPSLAVIGKDTIHYSYTTTNGCSRHVYEVVTINEAPQINFTVADTCVAVGSTDSTIFINQTTSADAVTGWLWKFDDVNSGIENTSILRDPKHLYTSSGRKYVSLTVSTVKNCISTREIGFNFGDKPQADFHWSTECFNAGSPVMFIDKSYTNRGEIISYKWKFHVNEQIDSSDLRNPEYTFESYGDYRVGLEVKTIYGCVDTFSDIFHLRPNIILSEDNQYTEDFETGMNGWISDQSGTSEANSWTLGQPTEGFIGAIGLNAWYTDIDNTKVEDSWISSPCFDFTGITKPMIKMDMWRIFDDVRDGAVLQYRTNNEDEWHNIGDLDDGINWYNKYSIDGKPGGQSIGWSDIIDTRWMEARHQLDDLVGLTDVQFRIAYGSNGTGRTNEGIAVDNIGIWKRDKIVLLEHFTNSADTACSNANEIVKAAITELNGDVVDIQYHTGFPGEDPMNLHNPTIVGARIFYYGLLDVPFTYMDGGYKSSYRYDYELNPLETNDINLQSLIDPAFRIDLNTEITDNSVNVSATLIAEKALAPSELTLHTVVIEREITGIEGANGEKLFRNVVKAMLPNAAGTYIYKGWAAGDTELTNHSWNFSNVFDADELRVVVFVQDEATKEIYQVAVDKFDFVSGKGNEYTLNREFKCMAYPNPASGHVYIRLNQPVISALKMDLFDNMGRLLESGMIEPWTEEYMIDTWDYHQGIYFIRISNEKDINEIIKIVVTK